MKGQILQRDGDPDFSELVANFENAVNLGQFGISVNGETMIGSLCANSEGSYGCFCLPGFSGNGTSCADIKECDDPSRNNCDENAICDDDIPGSYSCRCKDGYEGNGTHCDEIQISTDLMLCATRFS